MKQDTSELITSPPAPSYSTPLQPALHTPPSVMATFLPLKFLSLLALVLGGVIADKDFMLPPPPAAYSYDAPDLRSDASTFDIQDPLEALSAAIPGGGIPGQDYPILAAVPETDFSCAAQQFPGYYADTAGEAGCQVFHICQADGRHDSFLCPNGTIFSQMYFVCDWWFNVDCSASNQFFARNAEIGAVIAEAAAASLRTDSVAPSQTYGAPQQRQASPAPPQQYGAPQERQSVSTPPQQYGAPQERQTAPAPPQQYRAPQQRQSAPAPPQQYEAPQERQTAPAPPQQYGAPQERQTAPAPSQQYGAPQERQTAPAPSQQYGASQERQSIATPSRFYSFQN